MEQLVSLADRIAYDFYNFNVESNLPANSGAVTDGIVSPKVSLIFGPWPRLNTS